MRYDVALMMMTPETLDAVVARIRIPIGGILPMLVILVVVVIVWVIVQAASSGNKTTTPRGIGGNPNAPAPFCNTCGTMGHWVAQYQLWGCAKCQNYIGMSPPAGAPQAQPPAPVAMQQAAPFCPTCGTPGRWIPESNSFGCDRCRTLINKPA